MFGCLKFLRSPCHYQSWDWFHHQGGGPFQGVIFDGTFISLRRVLRLSPQDIRRNAAQKDNVETTDAAIFAS